VDALRAKQLRVVGNVILPYGCIAEVNVRLRNGDAEQPVTELSFFAFHDDPQRRQELIRVPVAWSLAPNERPRGCVVGRVQAGDDPLASIDVSHELAGTELVAWRMSPGYLTDEALIEGLKHLPVERWLEAVGPVAPGEALTGRLFYGESMFPRDRPADASSLAIKLRVAVHRLPADWANSHPGIHLQPGNQWREYLRLTPEPHDRPATKADTDGQSSAQEADVPKPKDAASSPADSPSRLLAQPPSRTLTLQLENVPLREQAESALKRRQAKATES
jgi:hypothetical protein